MNEISTQLAKPFQPIDPAKFRNPDLTAKGEPRAHVPLSRLDTLWINTGTLCNITCANCYIESSPTNDRLEYIRLSELEALLDEIETLKLATREIAFTGGEPSMNPDMTAMMRAALERGHEVLVLTNAMQPMQRPRVKADLQTLLDEHGGRITLRVSLDHHSKDLHETERGADTWDKALAGMDWLNAQGFRIAIAGRTCWNETEAQSRAGYADLIARRGWRIDPADPGQLVLFPEMNEREDVPEITTACWDILGKRPDQQMCATSRMVVKRKGAAQPAIVPCTLLPYDEAFEMGATLAASLQADGGNFSCGAVKLNHPHCAKFCVLGGASCSA
ncbi:MAG: radical SAM protein [Anderseniella sp.]|nr:radical SAM protein [Anderseniella sp.]